MTVYISINFYIIVSFYLNTSILSQVYNYVADSIFLFLFCKDNTIKAANTIKDIRYGNGRSVYTEIFQKISGYRFKVLTLKLRVFLFFLFFLNCLANFAFVSRSFKSHWQNPTQVDNFLQLDITKLIITVENQFLEDNTLHSKGSLNRFSLKVHYQYFNWVITGSHN